MVRGCSERSGFILHGLSNQVRTGEIAVTMVYLDMFAGKKVLSRLESLLNYLYLTVSLCRDCFCDFCV